MRAHHHLARQETTYSPGHDSGSSILITQGMEISCSWRDDWMVLLGLRLSLPLHSFVTGQMDLIIIISRRVMQCLLLSDTRFNNFIVRQKERPPRKGREKIASEKGCQLWLAIHDQKKEPDKYSELPNKNPPRPSTTIILAILTIRHPLHRERVPRNNKTVNFHFAYLTTIPSSLLYGI